MFIPIPNLKRCPTGLLGCCASILLSAGAVAAPITETEALRLVQDRPELAEWSRARLGEAEADAIAARSWSNPTLELGRERLGDETETAVKFSQPFDFSGRRGLRQDAARLRRDAVSEENRALMTGRIAEVRRAFFAVLRQQEAAKAVDAWAERFAAIDRVVDQLARAGEASGYDRRRLAREQRAAEAKRAELAADLERQRSRLAGQLGQRSVEATAGRLLPDAPPSLTELQARLDARPDLKALATKADAANADNAASRNLFPEVTVGLGTKQVDDGNGRHSGTMLSVSVPLPIFERQQAGDRRTAAQAQAARAELALARQQAEAELDGLHRQLTQLIAAAQRYRQDAVTPSADLVRTAEVAYRAGESTVLELLDAYKGALEAETTALDLEWKAREARIELDQLTGSYPQ